MNAATMEAGRKMDALVAEWVMGGFPPDHPEQPHYSTDNAAARQVEAQMSRLGEAVAAHFERLLASGPRDAAHICRAALAAVGAA